MSKLTLNEAIAQEKDYVREFKKVIETGYDGEICLSTLFNNDKEAINEVYQKHKELVEYHEQITQLLEELKRRREKDNEIMGSGALNNAYEQGYKKAVEDFVARYKFCDNRSCHKALNCADCIAEQLKEEAE